LKKIPTIRGMADVSDMGFTLMHEHLIFNFRDEHRDATVAYTRQKLAQYKAAGGRTIVDLTPFRRMDWLFDTCRGYDLNFILSTGYYLERKAEKLPKGALKRTVEQHMEMMEREITDGIEGTGIKARIIKVAGDLSELTPWETDVFTAAAKVSVKTKTPIATHACAGQRAQQDALLRAGADLSHVFYSHVEAKYGWDGRDARGELEFYLALLKEGSRIQFNNFDFYFDTPKDELIFLLRGVADKGYLDRIFVSIDMNYDIDPDGSIWPEAAKAHPETRKRDYAYIINETIPLLRDEVGFAQKEIDTIFIENPKRFFNWE
jgi:phosphotriesterase-related protein